LGLENKFRLAGRSKERRFVTGGFCVGGGGKKKGFGNIIRVKVVGNKEEETHLLKAGGGYEREILGLRVLVQRRLNRITLNKKTKSYCRGNGGKRVH